MDVQNDPFALDVMNHVINVIDSFSVNLEYKEKFSNLEIRDINTKQKGVFNTIKRTKWELLGEFEPVTVCKHQGKLGRDTAMIWASMLARTVNTSSFGEHARGLSKTFSLIMRLYPRNYNAINASMFTKELVRYLTKVLDYNCFSGEEKGCLFGTPSFINHACIPNCIFAIDEECQGKLVAVRDIDVGEEITIFYNTDDFDKKKESLKKSYDIDCNCGHCSESLNDFIADMFYKCICGKEGVIMCTRCSTNRYCSTECANGHSEVHSRYCKSFSQYFVTV